MNLQQIFYAIYDMTLHIANTPDAIPNSTDLWGKLREDITMLPPLENTFPQATFGHIMGGYDAGYYGYMWSK